MTDYSQFITFNYDGELFKTRDYIIKGNSQFLKFYTIDLNNQHEKLSNLIHGICQPKSLFFTLLLRKTMYQRWIKKLFKVKLSLKSSSFYLRRIVRIIKVFLVSQYPQYSFKKLRILKYQGRNWHTLRIYTHILQYKTIYMVYTLYPIYGI